MNTSDLQTVLNYFYVIYKNSFRTSQETRYVTATKPNRLMLFRETVAVSYENHTEHTNTLCGQNKEF
jgi:predicted component of type VI protein secretion system